MIHVLDLSFLGLNQAIAAFLVETSAGPVLIETGPHSCYPTLVRRLEEKGYRPGDLQAVLLTHIHLDHAGAAWTLAAEGVPIYLHPFGATHLENPSKLMESARRIYQDQMDRLWGEMHSIHRDKLITMEDGEKLEVGEHTFIAWHTPGHAKHHIAWQQNEILFSGDVAGVKIGQGPVVPPCPPPDINIDDWLSSISLIRKMEVKKLYLTHFGAVTDIEPHLVQLQEMLHEWSEWIKEHWEAGLSVEEMTPLFSRYAADQLRTLGVEEEGIKKYEAANPSWMSVGGLTRYWKKKAEAPH